MKNQRPKLKVRINKNLDKIDLSKIAPEKTKEANEILSQIKLPN